MKKIALVKVEIDEYTDIDNTFIKYLTKDVEFREVDDKTYEALHDAQRRGILQNHKVVLVEILTEKETEDLLESILSENARLEEAEQKRIKAYKKREAARAAKAEETARLRKLKKLEALKKELGEA